MFDSVRFQFICPFCEALINSFQSKDGPCTLGTLDPSQVRNFYSSCDSCGAWVNAEYIPPQGTGCIICTVSPEFIDENGARQFVHGKDIVVEREWPSDPKPKKHKKRKKK